jgi:DNA-binding IclR family transcriptional regulator
MFKSYLSYTRVNEYLDLLEKRQLIEYNPRTRRFHLTEKAIEYMNAYSEISVLLFQPRTPKKIEEKKIQLAPSPETIWSK